MIFRSLELVVATLGSSVLAMRIEGGACILFFIGLIVIASRPLKRRPAFCPRCRSELRRSAHYCHLCGYRLDRPT